jgi:hypothetical protein
MEPNEDVQEVLETPEELVEVYDEPAEEAELRDLDAEIAELKAKADKADELEKKNRQLYERLKKKEEAPLEPTSGLSARDILAIKDANITSEDLPEVEEFARYKKLTIAEALQSPVLRNILKDAAEERRTARATETKSPRGIAKSSAEDVLRKAEKTGEVPESMDEMKSMIEARLLRRMK